MHTTLLRACYISVAALILVFQYAPSLPAQQPTPWTGVVANDGLGWGSGTEPAGAISSDGRFVTFHSPSAFPGDTNGMYDVFVRDRHTRALTRVSVASNGAQANGHSVDPRISGDGRHVAFRTVATNLDPADTNDIQDVYVHDRDFGTTVRVSLSPTGEQGITNFVENVNFDISGDGRYVVFVHGFPSWNAPAVYLRDRDVDGNGVFDEAGQSATTRIDVTTLTGLDSLGNPGDPAISPDGRYIAYVALYSNEAGYVGQRLFLHDRELGTTVRVDRRDTLAPDPFGFTESPDFSAAGEIVYVSTAPQIVFEDNDALGDVFVYSILTQQNHRLVLTHAGAPALDYVASPAINADGRYVAFNGQEEPPGEEPRVNVYAIDRQTGTSYDVSVRSDGSRDNMSANPSLSADGGAIAYSGEHALADVTDGPGVYVATGLSVSPTAIEIPAEGGSATVDITAPADIAWDAQLVRVDEFGGYVTFESHSGAGPGSFDIQVSPNYTGEDQVYRVWVGSKEILVTQPGSPYIYFVDPYYGPSTGGTEITIQGWGFAQGATVTVGGVPAINVVVETSGGTIFATTPPSAVLDFVPVVVTNPNGRSHEFEYGFWYQDGTPPVITPNVSGTQGANGWYTSDVSLSWQLEDPESAIWFSNCPSVTVTSDTPLSSFTCDARSDGGESVEQVEIKRDATAPAVSIAQPQQAATYTQGQAVTLDFSCTDETSGVAACAPSQTGPALDTSTPGTFDFTVTATDHAGLQAAITVSYTVKLTATADLSPASGSYGNADVMLQATLVTSGGGLANKPVTFYVDNVAAGTANTSASGAASLTVSIAGRGAGTYETRVAFAGDATTFPASATSSLTVAPTALAIAANNSAKVYGEALPSFTATGTGFANGDTLASLNGTLSFSTSANATSAPGSYAVTPGGVTSPNYIISFVAGTLTVTKASSAVALSTSPNPSNNNQNVVLTAVVSAVAPGAGTATGTVAFRDNGVLLGTAPIVNGVATLTKKFKRGTHPLTATYAGDANFNGSSGGTTHSVP